MLLELVNVNRRWAAGNPYPLISFRISCLINWGLKKNKFEKALIDLKLLYLISNKSVIAPHVALSLFLEFSLSAIIWIIFILHGRHSQLISRLLHTLFAERMAAI